MTPATASLAADGWADLPRAAVPARVALIGVSGYGLIYLQLVRELRDRRAIQLVAAVVINAEAEAKNVAELRAGGCVVYADYEEMLRQHAGGIDLCLIPTGIQWHARMTIAALGAGMNVLVEKPLAGSVADSRAIAKAERAAGKFVAVGFQDLYTSGTQWLKQQLLDGAIGRVRSIRALGFWPRPASYYTRNNWTGRLQVDGVAVLDSPLNNAFGHFVNLALYFAARAQAEIATAGPVEAELLRAHAIESFDTAVVRTRTDSGVAVWLGFTHACRILLNPEIVIEGSAGRAVWSYEKVCTVTPTKEPERSHPLPGSIDTRRVMFAGVLRRLQDARAPLCTTAMAEPHIALIEAVHAAVSVRAISPERIDWITPPDNPSPIPAVRGIEAAMQTAALQHQLLREAGFSFDVAMPA